MRSCYKARFYTNESIELDDTGRPEKRIALVILLNFFIVQLSRDENETTALSLFLCEIVRLQSSIESSSFIECVCWKVVLVSVDIEVKR